MQTDRERNLLSWGIVFGTIAGAAAAYFFAPRRGDETKKILARKLNSVTQKSISKTQEKLIDLEVALERDIDKNRR